MTNPRVTEFNLENFWRRFPTQLYDLFLPPREISIPDCMPYYVRELKKLMHDAKKSGSNPNFQNPHREEMDILFLVCAGWLDNSLLELLEEKDIFNGYVPLIKSIRSGNIDALEWLLKHNINPNDYPDNSLSPIKETIKCGDIRSLELLINYKADVNDPSAVRHPLEYTLYFNVDEPNLEDPRHPETKIQMMKLLLEKSPNLSFVTQDTIQEIVRNRRVDVGTILVLLESKKDIEINTPVLQDPSGIVNHLNHSIFNYKGYQKGKIYLGYNLYKLLQGGAQTHPEASTCAQLVLEKTIEQIKPLKPNFNIYHIEGQRDLNFILSNEVKLKEFKELRKAFKDFVPFSEALQASDTAIQNLEKATRERKLELLTKRFSPLKTDVEAEPLIAKIKAIAPNKNVEQLDIKRVSESAVMEGLRTENIIENIEQCMGLKDKVSFHLTNHPFREAQITPFQILDTIKKTIDVATQTALSDISTETHDESDSSTNTQTLGVISEEIL